MLMLTYSKKLCLLEWNEKINVLILGDRKMSIPNSGFWHQMIQMADVSGLCLPASLLLKYTCSILLFMSICKSYADY